MECKHKLKHLRQEPSHEGSCFHVGSCLIDVFYCEKCGETVGPQVKTSTESTGTL